MHSDIIGTAFSSRFNRREMMRHALVWGVASNFAAFGKSSVSAAAEGDLAQVHLAYSYGLPIYEHARVTYQLSQSRSIPCGSRPTCFCMVAN
jgi:hypothetical protein